MGRHNPHRSQIRNNKGLHSGGRSNRLLLVASPSEARQVPLSRFGNYRKSGYMSLPAWGFLLTHAAIVRAAANETARLALRAYLDRQASAAAVHHHGWMLRFPALHCPVRKGVDELRAAATPV